MKFIKTLTDENDLDCEQSNQIHTAEYGGVFFNNTKPSLRFALSKIF